MRTMIRNTKKNILVDIFREIKLLRNEVSLFIPTEELKGYAHPERIKNSYKKAIKQYPVAV